MGAMGTESWVLRSIGWGGVGLRFTGARNPRREFLGPPRRTIV